MNPNSLRHSARCALLISSAWLCAALPTTSSAIDTDGDGMEDAVETSFGRNPNGVDYANFPFTDGFELSAGNLMVKDTIWNVPSGGEATVASGIGDGGTFGVEAAASDLNVQFQDGGAEIVWTEMHLKPVFLPVGAAPIVSDDTAAAFFFNVDGDLEVRDGASWSVVDLGAGFDQEAMHQLDILNDYGSKTWSIWVDGVERGTDLGFANDNAYYKKLRVNRSAQVIDGVTIRRQPLVEGYDAWKRSYRFSSAAASEPGVDADGDSVDNQTEYALGTDPSDAGDVFLPSLLVDGGGAAFTYRKNTLATDIAFDLESSETLTGWAEEAVTPDMIDETPLPDGTTMEVTVALPEDIGTFSRKFWRLRLTEL